MEDATLPVELDATAPAALTPSTLPGAGAALRRGTVVADFVITDTLGEGGMGAVYRAVPLGSGAAVALKWIASCDEDGRRRFAREAELAMRLDHPNVVRVLGFGQTDEGGLWLAMELLEGEDLEHRIRRGPLALAEVLPIARQAAAALEAAHAAGIVHRDIKPSNLWICRDGTVKVLDFGIALDADATQARLTHSALSLGTPAYMAVEQAHGAHDEDPRTDVWGLGATLFAALAGRPPFTAPTIWAQIVRVATDEPDALPESVPRRVQRVVLRALAKDRSARWPSPSALVEALAEAVAAPETAPTEVLSAVALGDEVRLVAILLGEDVVDAAGFRAAVEARGGRAEKLLRRRAVGVFGGDAWLGDEAARAVSAGLAVRAGGSAGRLGVATGRAVRRGEAVTGAVVAAAEGVVASRGVGVDPETARRIRGGFELDATAAPRHVVVRQSAGPVLGVRGPAGADVPLLGRARELADLRATFDEVVAERHAAAVLLVGPPGIGKSRLLHELLVDLGERATVLEARGEAHRAADGWHALAHALRRFLDVPEGTAAQEVRARLLAACPHRTAAELLGELVGADFPDSPRLRSARGDAAILRDQVVLAFGDLVSSLVETRPVLLVAEDLHWADPHSLRALEIVLRRAAERPLFVLGLARPDLETPLPDFRRLPLEGLGRRATREIVAAVLGAVPELEEHAAAIHERAAGNPYFTEELALAVRDGLRALPLAVEGAVLARLDALAREDKDLLRRAAVFGRRFWAEALHDLGEAGIEARLAGLRRRDLVFEDPHGRLAGAHEWRFRHALTREVAYATLTEDQRRELHGAAGRWLAARADAPALEVARHLELAGAPAEATPHWLAGAEAAFRACDSAAGLEASEIVLARGGLDRKRARALRMARADALHFLGRVEREAEELDALEAIAETAGDRARVAAQRSMGLKLRGRYAESLAAAERGLAEAPDDAWLLSCKAYALADAGRPEEGVAPATRAVELARLGGDPVNLGRGLWALAHSYAARSDVGAAWGPMSEALACFEDLGDVRRTAVAVGSLAYYAMVLGRWEEAEQGLRRTIELARAGGNRGVEGYAHHNRGYALAQLGRIDAGLAAEDEAMAVAAAIAEPRLRIASLAYRAAILLQAGRLDEAEATIAEARSLPPEQLGHLGPVMRVLRLSALVARGRLAEARPEAEALLAIRDAADGLEAFEADLFLAAAAAGVEGALARGAEILTEKAARITDPTQRASFLDRVPAHAELMRRARDRA